MRSRDLPPRCSPACVEGGELGPGATRTHAAHRPDRFRAGICRLGIRVRGERAYECGVRRRVTRPRLLPRPARLRPSPHDPSDGRAAARAPATSGRQYESERDGGQDHGRPCELTRAHVSASLRRNPCATTLVVRPEKVGHPGDRRVLAARASAAASTITPVPLAWTEEEMSSSTTSVPNHELHTTDVVVRDAGDERWRADHRQRPSHHLERGDLYGRFLTQGAPYQRPPRSPGQWVSTPIRPGSARTA
jgi:hypothetical protein